MSSKYSDKEGKRAKPKMATAFIAVFVVALMMSSAVGIINISETKAVTIQQ